MHVSSGTILEVQLRSQRMHDAAEMTHNLYKGATVEGNQGSAFLFPIFFAFFLCFVCRQHFEFFAQPAGSTSSVATSFDAFESLDALVLQ